MQIAESNEKERCATPRCKGEPALTYLGKPLCRACWGQGCEQDEEAAPVDGAANQDQADAETASASHEENEMASKKKSESKGTKKNTKAISKAKAPTGKEHQGKAAEGKSAEGNQTDKGVKARNADRSKKPKRVSAIDAASQVLKAAAKPMRAKELIEAMAKQGLWKSPGGKTPHATLYSAMLREITTKGKKARFQRLERGQFKFNKEAAA